MCDTLCRRKYLAILAGVFGLALLVFVVTTAQRKDADVAQAINQLHPGMSDADVQRLLHNVRHAPASLAGNSYVFYGFDEFITVVMDKPGADARVAQILHQPDGGPPWERFRRSFDRRFR